MKIPTSLIGAAGEHYIAYKLSSIGMPVGLTREGSDVIDLMSGDILNGNAVAIQVKTARNAKKKKYWEWSVGRKPLSIKNSSLIYAFVDLNEGSNDSPSVFIVPISDVVKQLVDAGFEKKPDWRTFYFKIYDSEQEKYLDRWELITNQKNESTKKPE